MSIKTFFGFNKKERMGIIVLLLILLMVIAAYMLIPQYLSYTSTLEEEKLRKQVELFIEARKKAQEQEKARQLQESKKQEQTDKDNIRISRKLSPFPFNPNNLPEEKWQAIGFSDKQISIIKNYEKSGGSFTRKGDLKRIYGIDEEEYQQLAPYIRIPKQEYKEKNAGAEHENQPPERRNLFCKAST
ncbi:MAG: helix-hairpin-helix domain-containing protein [Bacteroidales bacterium]|nr:helix-hairpin-helix domain-containing protein [Bacteroidales bacterium]